MGVVITVMSGAEDGKTFQSDKTPLILGRHPEDDVCLPYDTRTSRHHARISKEGNSYYIEDVGPKGKGSTNGTYIADKKITTKTELLAGQMIMLGGVWVKFDIG
jgi:pSer/pThr/pTyr-binding forkhead associated (FHA) protein